ncbi:SulP family inorganic anion transporter [Microbacterium sp. NC79]|uniref:SulP family inorganic anion transporter n=1 Tax=Microbacterium sp. NC79 TaxID=2851009 RepID=UPI001C2C97C9|nr:SulP family inorganic anion transporter [Microbacterium sp. NC79]MBV0895430.1 STAS domain-containing protein [Microbacterium sp. NC79]
MQRPLQGLTRKNIMREVVAGITLLAISVPLNIGYAQIAGLPATAGLYALIVPTIVYALMVSSRQVVASPDAAAAALVFSSLVGLGAAGENFAAMAAAQAILSGLMLAAFSFLKLGFLANFLSKPILIGFVGGLALEILVSQLAKMLGIRLDAAAEFFEKVAELFGALGSLNVFSLVISAASIGVLLIGRRLAPLIPWALVVLVAATAATVLWGLESKGVAVLGEVPAGPPQFALPMLDWSVWVALIPSALALTLVTVAEGLLVSRAYGEKHGYPVNPDQDLLAFGAANVAAGLSSSFAVGSSTSRSAAMDQAGSRTQVPSLVLAAGTLLLLLFGTALLAQIPSPAIGAVVAVAVFKLLGLMEFGDLWRQSRFEFAIGVVCFVGVLAFGPLGGLFLAFVLSLINLARRAANPATDVLQGSDDPQASLLDSAQPTTLTAPGVLVLRFAAPVFFANGTILADRITGSVHDAAGEVRALVLDAEAITDIDVTGAEALGGAKAWLAARGITLAYSRVRPELRQRLVHFGLMDPAQEYATNRAAVAALQVSPANTGDDVEETL